MQQNKRSSSRAGRPHEGHPHCFTVAAIRRHGRHTMFIKQLETSSSSSVRNASLSSYCRAWFVYEVCPIVLVIHEHSWEWSSRCIQKIWSRISRSSKRQPLMGRTINGCCHRAGVNEKPKDKWWFDERTWNGWKYWEWFGCSLCQRVQRWIVPCREQTKDMT